MFDIISLPTLVGLNVLPSPRWRRGHGGGRWQVRWRGRKELSAQQRSGPVPKHRL